MMSNYPACREHRPGIEPGLFPYQGNAITIILSVRTKWKQMHSKRCFITDLTIIECNCFHKCGWRDSNPHFRHGEAAILTELIHIRMLESWYHMHALEWNAIHDYVGQTGFEPAHSLLFRSHNPARQTKFASAHMDEHEHSMITMFISSGLKKPEPADCHAFMQCVMFNAYMMTSEWFRRIFKSGWRGSNALSPVPKTGGLPIFPHPVIFQQLFSIISQSCIHVNICIH